jgi:hypothetical protein
MPIKYIESEALAKYGKKLVSMLDLDEFEARLAAGEAIALLFDMLQASKEEAEEVRQQHSPIDRSTRSWSS